MSTSRVIMIMLLAVAGLLLFAAGGWLLYMEMEFAEWGPVYIWPMFNHWPYWNVGNPIEAEGVMLRAWVAATLLISLSLMVGALSFYFVFGGRHTQFDAS